MRVHGLTTARRSAVLGVGAAGAFVEVDAGVVTVSVTSTDSTVVAAVGPEPVRVAVRVALAAGACCATHENHNIHAHKTTNTQLACVYGMNCALVSDRTLTAEKPITHAPTALTVVTTYALCRSSRCVSWSAHD